MSGNKSNLCTFSTENITRIYYFFNRDCAKLAKPSKIVSETDKYYYTEDGRRYLKSQIGVPHLKCPTKYTYIELAMVDADEEAMRHRLSQWFSERVKQVRAVC